MAREEVRVSLFPFMSVLACTIGALIMLLTSLALSAVTPPARRDAAANAPAPSQDADRAEAIGRPAEGPAPPPAPEREAAESESLARVEGLLAQVDRLVTGRDGTSRPPDLGALEARLARVSQDRKLVSDLAALEKAGAALATDDESVEADIAALESRRETLPILIDPTGLSRHFEPWFIECDARGITLHRATDDFRHFEPREEISSSGELGRYLRRLRAMPGAVLILLVRSDGIDTADATHAAAQALGVRVASLPLPGRGALDFSMLRRAEGASPDRGADRE